MKNINKKTMPIIIAVIIITITGCANISDNEVKVNKEFVVDDGTIVLEFESVLSDKVEIQIPDSFNIMSEEAAKIKYPSENRPTIIYTNDDASVNLALKHTESQATNSQIQSYLESFKEMFENTYPSALWYDSGVTEINGKNIGYIELLTPAVDTEIYNLIWFTDLEGKLLLSTFNCTEEKMNDWKPIAKNIMNTQQYK